MQAGEAYPGRGGGSISWIMAGGAAFRATSHDDLLRHSSHKRRKAINFREHQAIKSRGATQQEGAVRWLSDAARFPSVARHNPSRHTISPQGKPLPARGTRGSFDTIKQVCRAGKGNAWL